MQNSTYRVYKTHYKPSFPLIQKNKAPLVCCIIMQTYTALPHNQDSTQTELTEGVTLDHGTSFHTLKPLSQATQGWKLENGFCTERREKEDNFSYMLEWSSWVLYLSVCTEHFWKPLSDSIKTDYPSVSYSSQFLRSSVLRTLRNPLIIQCMQKNHSTGSRTSKETHYTCETHLDRSIIRKWTLGKCAVRI
jgi:hypothetical protein